MSAYSTIRGASIIVPSRDQLGNPVAIVSYNGDWMEFRAIGKCLPSVPQLPLRNALQQLWDRLRGVRDCHPAKGYR